VPPIRPDLRSPSEFRPLRAETELLPTCNGSAHVSLADGSEALVGVKAEVHRTPGGRLTKSLDEEVGDKMILDDVRDSAASHAPGGSSDWVSLQVDISTLRDDDPILNFLSEMLREPLLVSASGSSLQNALVINSNWHWHLHIDILLLSPFEAARTSYPLPLLSLATHLALRSTRLPKLKSEGEEDPMVDDDWESSEYLYPRSSTKGKLVQNEKAGLGDRGLDIPPFTLLVMTVGENIIFDPSRAELAVADAVFAVSASLSGTGKGPARILAIRTIETPARDTMRGVPTSGGAPEGEAIPGVWNPRVGGLKPNMLKRIATAVMGDGTAASTSGVAKDVHDGLQGFLRR
jgi:exosome complex component RRP42